MARAGSSFQPPKKLEVASSPVKGSINSIDAPSLQNINLHLQAKAQSRSVIGSEAHHWGAEPCPPARDLEGQMDCNIVSGMVEGFELGGMGARDRAKFCSGSRAQKPAKLLRTMVLRSLLNWFCRRESLLTPLELRISTDPARHVLT